MLFCVLLFLCNADTTFDVILHMYIDNLLNQTHTLVSISITDIY